MNEFKFQLELTKAFERPTGYFNKETGEPETRKYIAGLASGINIDLEEERMAETAILSFKRAIEEGMFLHDGQWSLIPLRSGHREEWDDILGYIVKAEVDAHWNLYIEAELDPTSPNGMGLFEKLTRPVERGRPLQLGLSVGGYVVTAGEEWDETLQRYVRVYHEVKLTEVSVVSRPANPKTYLYAMAKSVPWEKVKGRTVLVSESDMTKDISPNQNATAEVADVVTKAEEVVAADATVAEEVEKTETVEVVAEEQVEKTDASEDAAVDAVEKSVEPAQAADGEGEVAEVEKSTDPLTALQEQMAELAKAVTVISESLVALSKAEVEDVVEVEVEKSVEIEEQVVATDASVEKAVEETEAEAATPATEVAKSAEIDIEAIVKAAVEQVIKTQVEPLQARITELESEPVDKSIAVRTADEVETDPLSLVKAEMQTLSGRDALRRSLQIAAGQYEGAKQG